MAGDQSHKAGFVNIIGLPNAGKSTLTNALLDMDLSITNPKPQTTRHRIHAILNGPDYQIVVADTPGFIENPEYAMQEAMNKSALSVLEDADVLLFMHDITARRSASVDLYAKVAEVYKGPIFLLLSKIDLVKSDEVIIEINAWKDLEGIQEIIPMSSISGLNVDKLVDLITAILPFHPPYYDKESLSDRPVRFFASEIIRKHILSLYSKEVPYSCDVKITEFKENGTNSGKTLIRAVIFVLRKSQRQILIGKNGSAIKLLGMKARKDIETFIGNEVFLDLTVKLRDNWRNDEKDLQKLGY